MKVGNVWMAERNLKCYGNEKGVGKFVQAVQESKGLT